MEENQWLSLAGVDFTKRQAYRDRPDLYLRNRTFTVQPYPKEANVNPDTRVRDLTDEETNRIKDVMDASVTVEGDLRREVAMNIKRLEEIGCYRGIRHRKGLPSAIRIRKTMHAPARARSDTVANKK